ncbi:MAG: ADOP family duplicated permease, partial [Gemmatimonadales bacterium]
ERAEQVDVGFVSANFFRFLGVDAVVGRTFSLDENATAGNAMGGIGPAVISHGLWARRYGSDPAVLGRTVYLSGVPVQISGVMPADFSLVLPYLAGGVLSSGANDNVDVWRILPEQMFPTLPRSLGIVSVLGRLAPGVTMNEAQQEFDRLAEQLRAGYRVHRERGTRIDIVPLHADVVGEVRAIILSLFGAVGVVLLVACGNVANLVSVQANHRSREVAVRMALGAHRVRILRQLFTEYALLAAAGAAAGVALAQVLIRTIVGIAPPNIPMLEQVGIDLRALGFAVLAASVATLLFGIWPAMSAAGASPATQLTAGARGAIGRGNRFRSGMVSAEIALSLVLLVGGGLLLRSFMQLQRATLGFEPTAVLTAKVSLGHGPYDDEDLRRGYWDALSRELEQNPAIQSAGLVWPLPFEGRGAEVPYANTGGESADWGRYVTLTGSVLPGYFATMRAEVLDGREFEEQDLDRAGEIAVVDDLIAENLYPGGHAVGKMVWVENAVSSERRPLEIIGVVRHIRHSSVTGVERPVIYRLAPAARNLALVVRATGGIASVIPELRRITAALDKDVPLFDERTLASYLGDQIAPTRFTMTLAATFGIVALLMAVVGLYGVVSYTVAQRTAELGVRMALGAGQGSIVRLIMGRGAVMAGVGIVMGLGVALGVTRAIRSLLVEVPANDPLTFAVMAGLLAAAALVASYVPASRAARLDPA